MKAWRLELETMAAAKPVQPENGAENWLQYERAGQESDRKLLRDWSGVVPGSLAPCRLVPAAIQALENRGHDVGEAEALLPEGLRLAAAEDLPGLNVVTARIFAALRRAPRDPASPYWSFKEYLTWEDVAAEVDFGPPGSYGPAADDYPARTRGGWLGQIVGSSVGTQMEGYTSANVIEAYGDITGYLRPPETYNDDLTYALAFLDAFGRRGHNVSSLDIALAWAALIPDGYSAEETALANIRAGLTPPETGRRDNWFSDWIGAQMRSAVHGLVAPGRPALAAELAWRDAVVSHANNGALGGVFNAVLTSLAFVEDDVDRLLERTTSLMPARSEYRQVVQGALDECRRRTDWRETWRILEERHEKYHWIHAYPNAAAEIMALHYGGGDFDRTLNIICQAGRDTDCNAGQILTALGVMGRPIADKWIAPLGDVIQTYMRGYRRFSLDELAGWTTDAARRAAGGL
ncbi:MAG: ADP-ribosylglycohydrolase family protein [Deltaproteobacteria bacterium]|jgi:ADP-ribosylglycohydrolase|nr:ADP-ribosylglycohydrolase family protein [Deltaproteobacteria bacterium]